MMKRIVLSAGLGLAMLVGGCVVLSVYPYYTEKDLTFDPALVGVWVGTDSNKDASETWTFEKAGDDAYKFSMVSAHETNLFSAHLFKLKDHLFFDFLPLEKHDSPCLPPHYLMSVTQVQPTLKWQIMDYKWLDKYLMENPKAIRYLEEREPGDTNRGTFVLTAETKELQQFVLKNLKTEGAFAEPVEMKKMEGTNKP